MLLKKEISKEEINTLPLFTFEGRIHLITTKEEAVQKAKLLLNEKILGFDTETRASFQKGESYNISLLQLSTKNDAYLFRLNLFDFPAELAEVLSSKTVIKAGVAIRDDIKGLKKLYPFKEENFFELSELAKKIGIKNFGLRALTAIFLEKRLSKGAKVTNWERKELTPAQIEYAACDAYTGLLIFEQIAPLLNSFSEVNS